MSTMWFRSFQSRLRFQTCIQQQCVPAHLPPTCIMYKHIIAWTIHPSAAQLFSHVRFQPLYYYAIASMRCGNSGRLETNRDFPLFTCISYIIYRPTSPPRSSFPILPTQLNNIHPWLLSSLPSIVKTCMHINITTVC